MRKTIIEVCSAVFRPCWKRLIRIDSDKGFMASLWDLGKSRKEKLADQWEDTGVLQDKVEQHREKFSEHFKQNMDQEVPTHPYKIYREIVESNELSDEERIALEHMKDEYSERWQTLKQRNSN